MRVQAILIAAIVQISPPQFQDLVYPAGAHAVGWLAASLPMLPVPAFMIYQLFCRRRADSSSPPPSHARASAASVEPLALPLASPTHNSPQKLEPQLTCRASLWRVEYATVWRTFIQVLVGVCFAFRSSK